MSKTALGELMASDHASHAVAEMRDLDAAFMALRAKAPAHPMPAFDTLRNAMPDWKTLHGSYKGAQRIRESSREKEEK